MESATFSILGPPTLSVEGESVRLHSAKATALLAYLVCHPDSAHSRDRLASLFWGSYPESKARQSLRQALYSLRQTLGAVGERCLEVDAQTVTYRPCSGFRVDVSEFERLAREKDRASLQQAADLYRGPVLDSLAIEDAPEYEEWLRATRERVLLEATRAMHALIETYLVAGESQQALDWGRRLASLDALNEKVYRQLMRAYSLVGDVDAVRRQYRRCRDLLAAELGVEPADETRALYEQLTAGAADAPGLLPSPPQLAAPTFPYLGCEVELARLTDAFEQALRGQAGLVWVTGEAGSGKTELVLEFLRRMSAQRRLRWLRGRNYEAELGMPYTMWADALSVLATEQWQEALSGLPEVWQEQLGRLALGIRPGSAVDAGISEAENHLRLLHGVVQALLYLARSEPLVLVFDDLQWSDTASLELLHYAARHVRRHPILLVAAYRSESVADNRRLAPFLQESDDPTVTMTPLARADVKRLLAHLGLPGADPAVERVHGHCHGNRLMFVETVRLLQESQDAPALLRSEAPLPIPDRVQDLIEIRLLRLPDAARRTLAAAAVIGRPCELPLLRRVSDQAEVDLLAHVEQLVAGSLLREEEAGDGNEQISFCHDYVRRVAYEGLARSYRRALHRRTAEALLAVHKRPQHIAEAVAFHYQQAGDANALSYLRMAADEARSLYALPQATRLVSRALDFHERNLSGDVAGRFTLLLSREQLLGQQGRRREQAEDIEELLAMAETLGDAQRQATALIRQAGYFSETHDITRSSAAAQRALELYSSEGDRRGEAQALRELGFLYWSNHEPGLALQYAREALRRHRRLGDIEGEATALHNLAEIHRGLGSPRQAISFYEQAQQLHWARRDHQRQGLTLYGMAHALRQLGEPRQALEKYRQTLEQTEQSGDLLMASRVYHEMATMAADSGAIARASRHMEQAASISRDIGYVSGLAHSLIILGFLYARMEQVGQARAALEEAMTWLELMEDSSNRELVAGYLRQLDADPGGLAQPTSEAGWVKTHVNLLEGKVYCEFESPLAVRSRPGGGSDGREGRGHS